MCRYSMGAAVKGLCFFLGLVCLLLHAAVVSPETVSAAGKIVRVGYYENDTFQAGASDKLTKTGYAYEYMQRLRMYTDWQYEYVYGEYGDLYQKLVDGDIDILAGLAYRESRASIIGYPKQAMGDTPYWFLKRIADSEITANPMTFSGRRIGVVDGAMRGITESYLAKHGVSADIVLFNDVKARDNALVDGTVDIIIVEGNGTGAMKGVAALAEAGRSDYFLCTNIRRPDILLDLNRAQQELFEANPELKAGLSSRWFRQNAVSTTLSPREQAWLKSHPTFIVGCYDNFLPFSAKDSEGKVKGVITDIAPALFKALKADDIDIEYKSYGSYEEMRNALEKGEVHAIFPIYSCYWPAEQFQVMPTESVITSHFNLVFREEYPDMDTASLAMVRGNAMTLAFATESYPNNPIHLYDTVEECLDAVAEGRAQATVISGLRSDYLLRLKESYQPLRISQIPRDVIIGFAAGLTDADTVDVLNHGIRLMDPNFALTRMSQYEERHKTTLAEYIREHVLAFLILIVLAAMAVVAFILRELRLNKDNLAKEERQKQALQEKVEEISRLNTSLQEHQGRLEEASEKQKLHIREITELNVTLQDKQAQLEELASEQEEQIEQIKKLNTTLEEAREAAEAASSAKTTFLFNMSHDVRTPMNAIMGYRDLLEKEQEDAPKREHYLKKIKEASATLLAILNNVLDMAKLEKGGIELEESVWRIDSDSSSLYSIFDELIAKKNLDFSRVIHVEHPLIYCDVTKLRQVFVNIVSNACNYTPPGGRISMQIDELPSDRPGWGIYRTTLTDTGIGISEEFLPHLFEEFSREQNTTKAKVEGTGLGLPIVKRLVEFMHGTIEVTSQKGKGSTVVVTIPHRYVQLEEENAPPEVQKPQEPEAVNTEVKRILLAEDNEINAEIAITILEEFGYHIEHAADGKICVEMLEKAPAGYYDLVLMDIQMPNMNGYEAARAIRGLSDKRKAGIPVVALTANAFEDDKKAAFDAGMNGHVAKPIDIPQLLAAVQEALN